MAGVGDIYFDSVSQIRMGHWTRGRTALIGDAAACVSLLAGEGTGLAMAEAYVLAGELRDCGGDHAAVFARYEDRMMPFLKAQAGNGGDIRLILRPEKCARDHVPQPSDRAVSVPVPRGLPPQPVSAR